MLKKHLEETNRLTKTLKKKNAKYSQFCESCLCENPETDDGYTTCCNERRVDSNEALANAKRYDIQSFLDTKFKTSSQGHSNNVTFELSNKKIKWSMNLERTSAEEILRIVKEKTKGLRKEF